MVILTQWQEALGGYLQRRLKLLCFLAGILVMGIIFGALAVRTLSGPQINELLTFLQDFFQGFRQEANISQLTVTWHAWLNNLKTLALCFLLGISVIGAPLILAVVFFRGFILGFTVGFLMQELSLKGLVFATLAVLPQNIFFLPIVLISACACLSCGGALLKGRMGGEGGLYPLWGCLIILGIMLGFALIGAVIEGFLTPFFLYVLRDYFA